MSGPAVAALPLTDPSGRALDRIAVSGIAVRAHHGVLAHERRDGQDFACDVTMHLDTRAAGEADDLGATVHYGEVTADVVAVLSAEPVDLVETLAERVATTVLRRTAVRAVDVTIHKPQAPVGHPVADVTVSIRRLGRLLAPPTDSRGAPRPARAVLGLGANLGEPVAAIEEALAALRSHPDVRVVAVSPLARTAPVLAPGQEPQPDYVNAVAVLETTLAPLALLALTQRLEARAGRVRGERWGARVLDLDLVDADGIVAVDPVLTLPHPRAHERDFVLRPWLWADPAASLPRPDGGRVAVADLLGDGAVERLPGAWASDGTWRDDGRDGAR